MLQTTNTYVIQNPKSEKKKKNEKENNIHTDYILSNKNNMREYAYPLE